MGQPGYPLISFQLVRPERSVQTGRDLRFHLIRLLHPSQLVLVFLAYGNWQITHSQHFGQLAHLILRNLHIRAYSQALQGRQLPFQRLGDADILRLADEHELAVVRQIGLQHLFQRNLRVPQVQLSLHLEPVDAGRQADLPVGAPALAFELDFRSLRPFHGVVVRTVVQELQQRQQILRLVYFQLFGAVLGIRRRIGDEIRQVVQIVLLLLEVPLYLEGAADLIPLNEFGRPVRRVEARTALIGKGLPFNHIGAFVGLDLHNQLAAALYQHGLIQSPQGRYVNVDELLQLAAQLDDGTGGRQGEPALLEQHLQNPPLLVVQGNHRGVPVVVHDDLPGKDAALLVGIHIGLGDNLVNLDVEGHLGPGRRNLHRPFHIVNAVGADQQREDGLCFGPVHRVDAVFAEVPQYLDNLLVSLIGERIAPVQILAVGKQPFFTPAAVRLRLLLPEADDGFAAEDELHPGTHRLVGAERLRKASQRRVPVIHRRQLRHPAVTAEGVHQFLMGIGVRFQVRRALQLHDSRCRRVLQFIVSLDIVQVTPFAHQEQNLLLQRAGLDGHALQLVPQLILVHRLEGGQQLNHRRSIPALGNGLQFHVLAAVKQQCHHEEVTGQDVARHILHGHGSVHGHPECLGRFLVLSLIQQLDGADIGNERGLDAQFIRFLSGQAVPVKGNLVPQIKPVLDGSMLVGSVGLQMLLYAVQMLHSQGVQRKPLADLILRTLYEIPSRNGIQDRVVARFHHQRFHQLDNLPRAGNLPRQVHHLSGGGPEAQDPQRFKERPLHEALIPEHLGPACVFLQHIVDVLQQDGLVDALARDVQATLNEFPHVRGVILYHGMLVCKGLDIVCLQRRAFIGGKGQQQELAFAQAFYFLVPCPHLSSF